MLTSPNGDADMFFEARSRKVEKPKSQKTDVSNLIEGKDLVH